MTERCGVKVASQGGWYRSQCSRKGKVFVDGKWYCGTHDPAKVKERADKSQAKFDAESRVNKRRWAKIAAYEQLRDALRVARHEVDGPIIRAALEKCEEIDAI